jgi:hypothetical protein
MTEGKRNAHKVALKCPLCGIHSAYNIIVAGDFIQCNKCRQPFIFTWDMAEDYEKKIPKKELDRIVKHMKERSLRLDGDIMVKEDGSVEYEKEPQYDYKLRQRIVICRKCGRELSRFVRSGDRIRCDRWDCAHEFIFLSPKLRGAFKPETNKKENNMRLFQVAVTRNQGPLAVDANTPVDNPELVFWTERPFFAKSEEDARTKGLLMADLKPEDAEGLKVIAVPFE